MVSVMERIVFVTNRQADGQTDNYGKNKMSSLKGKDIIMKLPKTLLRSQTNRLPMV